MNILIVEDDQASYAYIKRIITSHYNCEVMNAKNGIDALKMLENSSYDGIISDISMPMMSGLELLEVLISNDETKNIPIMMTSANSMRIDVEKALQLGATDYLLKPLMAHETLSRINRFVDIILKRKEETINKKNNDGKKIVLIVSSNLEKWREKVVQYENDFKFAFYSSGAEGLEFYLNNFPAIVIIDRDLKILNDEFIAKKIKKLINEKFSQNVRIETKIIGVNKSEQDNLFDLSIDSPEMLIGVLEDLNENKLIKTE